MFIHKLSPNVFHCIYRWSLAKKNPNIFQFMGIPPPPVTPKDGEDSPFYKNEFAVEIRGFSIRHPKMVVPKIGLPLKYLKSSSFDWDCPLPSSYGSMDPWKPKFMACRSAGACRGMPGHAGAPGVIRLLPRASKSRLSCVLRSHNLGRFDVWHSGTMGCT
jgi:hypothetical protein